MASLTLRNVKGGALTHTEADQNFGTLFVSASITGSGGNLLLFSRGSGSTAFATGSGAITASMNLNLQHITNVGATTTKNITANNFITTSDKRLKSEIEPIANGLEIIKQFSSYTYNKEGKADAGFIAQEVQESIPYSVHENDLGMLTMNDRPILAHLHKAILELEERVKELEGKE